MLTISRNRQLSHFVTFMVWALLAASLVYWVLKWVGASSDHVGSANSGVVGGMGGQISSGDQANVAKLLGAISAAPSGPQAIVPTRFVLVGVLANTASHGAALIAVGDAPPKPFRVGAEVEQGLVLQAVKKRSAMLGAALDGPAALTLELPPLATAGGAPGGAPSAQ